MEKENSIDKIDKQIKELQKETENYNEMLEETEEEPIETDETDEKTKEFNNDNIEENIEEKVEEELEEVKETKELNKEEFINTEEKQKTDNSNEKEVIKKDQNKKKKIIIIVLIILIILTLSFIIILGIKKASKKTPIIKEVKDEEYSAARLKKILNNYGKSIENVISINSINEKNSLSFEEADKLVEFPNKIECETAEIYNDGKIFLSGCTIDGHKTKAKYGEKQEIKEDDTTENGSFYVYEKNNNATLEKPKEDIDSYKKYLVTTNTEPREIELLRNYEDYVFYYDKNNDVQMKNYKTNKNAIESPIIKSVLPIKNNYGYNTVYIGVNNGNSWGIYNLKNNTIQINYIYSDLAPFLHMGISGPPKYIDALNDNNIAVRDNNNKIGVINYKTGDIIIPFDTNAMIKSGSYLWKYEHTYNEKTLETEYTNQGIYDYDGNKYLDKKYDEIYGIVNGTYILVKDDKNIKLVLIDGKEIYNYKEINNLGSINYSIDYNQNPLFMFNKKDKTGTSYENECIEISYDNKTKKGSYKDYICGGIAKPILYLYPTETTNVKVTFEHPDLLKTTYPKYKKEWNVTVKEDGTIIDKNGRTYYALYWDEKQINKVDFKTGYYVTSNNAIKFLETKLFEIGLTEREANEFIMYWLPKLENNKKSLVYFELTEEKETYNKINITPKPDSLLRLTIHIKKVNKATKIKEQKINPFKREGFTAVEWGGVEY